MENIFSSYNLWGKRTANVTLRDPPRVRVGHYKVLKNHGNNFWGTPRRQHGQNLKQNAFKLDSTYILKKHL